MGIETEDSVPFYRMQPVLFIKNYFFSPEPAKTTRFGMMKVMMMMMIVMMMIMMMIMIKVCLTVSLGLYLGAAIRSVLHIYSI